MSYYRPDFQQQQAAKIQDDSSEESLRRVEDVLSQVQLEWRFLTSEDFNPVILALSLLDKSSLGKDINAFKALLLRLETAMDAVVNEYYQGFNNSTTTYSTVKEKIKETQIHVKKMKNVIQQCKDLLHVQRSDLVKLWARSNTYKEMIRILDVIEDLKKVPDEIEELIHRKHYYTATTRLLKSLEIANEEDMLKINALEDLRHYLQNMKNTLHEVLTEELHNHIYLKTTYSRDRTTKDIENDYGVIDIAKYSDKQRAQGNGHEDPNKEEKTEDTEQSDEYYVTDDLDVDPETDSFGYTETLLETLCVLGKLPSALESIQQRVPIELYQLVDRIVDEVDSRAKREVSLFNPEKRYTLLASGGLQAIQQAENEMSNRILRDFTISLYSKLESMLEYHKFVLDVSAKIQKRNKATEDGLSSYSFKEVWMSVQSEVKSMLYDYLIDTQKATSIHKSIPSVRDMLKNGSQIRDRNKQLFQLGESVAKISAATMYQHVESTILKKLNTTGKASSIENTDPIGFTSVINDKFANTGIATGHRLLVQPDVYHVSIVIKPTLNFLDRLKEVLPTGISETSDFNEFLDDFIVTVFLPRMEERVMESFTNFTDVSDSFHVDPDFRDYSQYPLFKSATTLVSMVNNLCELLYDMPFHQKEYIAVIEMLLKKYREKCFARFKATVTNGSNHIDEADRSVLISAMWAENEEIVSLLKQNCCLSKSKESEPEIDENLLRQEIMLETKLKKERSLHPSELVVDSKKLKFLATLHHTLMWLVDRINALKQDNHTEHIPLGESIDNLPNGQKGSPSLTGESFQNFVTILDEFQQLAETCLFMLHIEFRCQSMYYLDLATREGNYYLNETAHEPDSYIVTLNTTLVNFEECMTETLPLNEISFVFNGLSYLMSHVLITNIRYIKQMNSAGISKMIRNILALKQNLANIALPHGNGLDEAKKYYELIGLSPQELIQYAGEHIHSFTFEQYKYLLDLIEENNQFHEVSDDDQNPHRNYVRELYECTIST
ncbi:exocyst subunit [Basidiobolus ranarum]|uniref:Exocyst complex component Sec8 n=1 Tax=Basidiobolus ranarum TaxID=34480 RepID=A0ABR2WA37_9FUNG